MSQPFPPTRANRREFLGRAILGTAAVGAGLSARSLPAAEPVQRNGKSHLKLSLAAYSFNRLLGRTPEQKAGAKMTLEEFIQFCADQQLDGCELTAYYFPKEITDEYLLKIKEMTFRLGLDISGTAIGNDFCLPEGPARQQQLEMTRNWIDYSAFLGAPVIRIFAGKVPKGDTEDAAIERCVEGINQSLEYAAKKGVCLALENHGGITATPAQMLKIVKAVKRSPWFGVNLDGGNFHTADPYADLEQIAPYAINAQVKVEVHPEGKGKQEADLARVIRILREANYRGYVALEYEAQPDPFETIPSYLKQLRELVSCST